MATNMFIRIGNIKSASTPPQLPDGSLDTAVHFTWDLRQIHRF